MRGDQKTQKGIRQHATVVVPMPVRTVDLEKGLIAKNPLLMNLQSDVAKWQTHGT